MGNLSANAVFYANPYTESTPGLFPRVRYVPAGKSLKLFPVATFGALRHRYCKPAVADLAVRQETGGQDGWG
jgi:hypothetical protein